MYLECGLSATTTPKAKASQKQKQPITRSISTPLTTCLTQTSAHTTLALAVSDCRVFRTRYWPTPAWAASSITHTHPSTRNRAVTAGAYAGKTAAYCLRACFGSASIRRRRNESTSVRGFCSLLGSLSLTVFIGQCI